MIRGIHGLLYSSNSDATRAFLRDKVKLPGSDIGGGWWIFDLPAGDLGVHPAEHGAKPGDHDVSFYCDDIQGTVRDMKARGVKFTKPVADHGYGLVTYIEAPGGVTIQLYEPKYVKASAAKARVAKRSASAKTAGKKTAKRTKAGAKKTKKAR
ncbi:MAG: VOC family protein [Planctomycetota bacterium]